MAEVFYAPLSTVVSLDQIPEQLNLVSDEISEILSNVYFRNLESHKSPVNTGVMYEVDIISFSKLLRLNIPGTGMELTLNPDLEPQEGVPPIDFSVMPISIFWRWDILNIISDFKSSNFSFSASAFFNLLAKISQVSDKQLLAHSLDVSSFDPEEEDEEVEELSGEYIEPVADPYIPTQYDDPDSTAAYDLAVVVELLEIFAENANERYPVLDISLPLNPDTEIAFQEIVSSFNSTDINLSSAIFELCILDEESIDQTFKNLLSTFIYFIGDDPIEKAKEILIPQISVSAQVSAGLAIPRNALIPLTAENEIIPGDVRTKLIFDIGEFVFDSKSGFGFDDTLTVNFHPDTPKAQIANTGIILGFTNAKLDCSRDSNIPEADAAGYPVDFVGLYVQNTTIEFTRFGSDDTSQTSAGIFAENLLIGTGGVSGTIGIESSGALYRKFGNFAAELTEFSLIFRQNAIIGSAISGFLTIPGFKQGTEPAVLAIQANIKDNGDFNITAKPLASPLSITLPNVFEIQITSLEVGRVNDRYYVEVGGKLSFIADIPVLGDVLPKDINITGSRIWDNGDFEFPGGRLKLQKVIKLKVGPVKMEVVELGLAPYKKIVAGVERKYRSFAFEGMINTGRAGIDVAGNGIKYYFSVDGLEFDHFIRIDGIEIDIAIPGNVPKERAAFLLHGKLSMKNPDPEIPASSAAFEYAGDVTFSLPRLDFAGTAGMRLNPGIPAFLVDIGMEMANPVPIGGTGLGIYGFRGLIGQHYMPDKNGYATWLEYYRAPPPGVSIDKFESRPGTSLGAGMAMATSFDSGRAFTSKVFLLLGLPDVFLLEGQAGILRKRIGLDDEVEPPFTALIVIGDRSIRANLAVDYKLPDEGALKGSIMSLQGALDMAFFFNNSSGWYINIGKDNPESERVRAKILTLFNAHAYLMLSMQGIKAGAGAKFDFNKNIGPVGVGIGAFLNLGGFISFRPFQIGGFIQLGGYAYIKVFKFKLGFAVAASLAVEAPHPFNIVGSLKLVINLPWPFKDIKLGIELTWRINKNRQPLLDPIPILQLPEPATGYSPVIATNMLTDETFQLNYVLTDDATTIPAPDSSEWKYNFTIPDEAQHVTLPLDSFIDIDLLKPVKPGVITLGGGSSQLPLGYKELLPPVKGIDVQVQHQFELFNVQIKAWKDTGGGTGEWVDYHVYESITAIVNANTGPDAVDLETLKIGYWQFADPGRFNKIRLLSQNMFSYSSGSLKGTDDLDARNFKRKDIFCYDAIRKEIVVNWKNEADMTTYPNDEPLTFTGVDFTFEAVNASARYESGWNDESLLLLGSGGQVLINFPEPVTYIRLLFGDNTFNVGINYIRQSFSVDDFGQAVSHQEIISVAALLSTQKNQAISYDQQEDPIDQIVLHIDPKPALDYTGNLLIGGHYPLKGTYPGSDNELIKRGIETNKALIFVSLYNRSFSAAEVLGKDYRTSTGIVAQWPMESNADTIGTNPGILRGNPETAPGYYENYSGTIFQHYVYYFTANDDALFIPYKPALKVENGDFAVEATAIFNPGAGISTLLQKVKADPVTNYRKGFTLHLIQELDSPLDQQYPDLASVPSFIILLTLYNGLESYSVQASAKYTVDCNTSMLSRKQYKPVLVSVNRLSNTLEIFIDGISRFSGAIPSQLSIYDATEKFTFLNELRYMTETKHGSLEDNQISEETVIEEVEILDKGINKVIQPVWRPDTTFAVMLSLQDRVNGNIGSGGLKNYIFGFKTAGPVGHFHQQNKKYQELAAQDRADEFKLAKLYDYIDMRRSSPDAQGRFDLSKPVFFHDPKIRLFFTEPYIYAMFSDWDSYQGIPAVSSKLEIQLLDPEGTVIEQQLNWEPMQEVLINESNLDSLPEDLKIIYLLNKAASEGSCNSMVNPIKKRIQRGYYQFDDLLPDQLYTAIFNSVYPADPIQSKVEVHKYNFKTSRYAGFLQQASSFILDGTPGDEVYAIDSRTVSFSQEDIDLILKPLVNNSTENDPAGSLQYAEKFDRLLYGGLEIRNLEGPRNSVITLLINTDPADAEIRQLLGILIRNPEPFNDPKLPDNLLANTLQMTLSLISEVIPPADFIYIHSGDTSGVMITNEDLNIPIGIMKLDFRYKIFNGEDYDTLHEDYSSNEIDLALYF